MFSPVSACHTNEKYLATFQEIIESFCHFCMIRIEKKVEGSTYSSGVELLPSMLKALGSLCHGTKKKRNI